jgi:hypothetical protein
MIASSSSVSYIPGQAADRNQPLGRYLPPVPQGVTAAWLTDHIPPGAWVLEPFAAAPQPIIEAARTGYRLLVAANNPIMRLLLEVAAAAPSAGDLQAILATLAGARIREERVEPLLRSIYETICDNCHQMIDAQAFIWNSKTGELENRIYSCPHCGEKGDFPAIEFDQGRATQFLPEGLHHARALARVAPLDDPDRVYAEEALSFYPPRAVYALITLVNKLDGLNLESWQEKYLQALLLSAFDQGNTLWPYPGSRQRPRQLTIPPVYRENNIWLALEQAINQWSSNLPAVPITTWPQLPPEEGGICLFEGRIRELVENLPDIHISAVTTTIPRPNQAFWTLSALWAGWLWGHEAVEHFKSVLRRQRYGWSWHTTALQVAFESMVATLPARTPIFGMLGEAEPGLLSATSLASQLSGLTQQGIALRVEQAQAQFYWQGTKKTQKPTSDPTDLQQEIETCLCKAAQDYIRERGEPVSYLSINAAGLEATAEEITFPKELPPSDVYKQIQQGFQDTLTFGCGFLHLNESEKSLEVGQWWLQEPDADVLPLADRVEKEVVAYLLSHSGFTLLELEKEICSSFSGLMVPESELLEVCLESYGEQVPPESGNWQLRVQDSPTKRLADIAEMGRLIQEIGTSLGFDVQQIDNDPPVYSWKETDRNSQHIFTLHASAVLSKSLSTVETDSARRWFVIPGSRANLLVYKMRKNPVLQEKIESGWQFIKFRHLRRLAENPSLDLASLVTQLGLDPLNYTEPQLRML